MNALPRQGYRFTLMHSVSAIALIQSHPSLGAAVGYGDPDAALHAVDDQVQQVIEGSVH